MGMHTVFLRSLAGIPKAVEYRPKWVIACELVERSRTDGVKLGWLTADSLYGRCAEFRNRIATADIKYVVDIPPGLFGWTSRPEVQLAGMVVESGKTLKVPRVAPGEKEARRADQLWARGGPTHAQYRIKDTTKGPQIWDVRSTRFYARENDIPGPESTLIIARNVITNETKYFISNVIDDTPLGTLLYVAFTRWYIEHIFKESKSRVGLDHIEVRSYLAVKRHLIISAVSLLFLVEQSQRLKTDSPMWSVPQVSRMTLDGGGSPPCASPGQWGWPGQGIRARASRAACIPNWRMESRYGLKWLTRRSGGK